MRKDSISTLSGWTEENPSSVFDVQIRQTLSRKQGDPPSVEPAVEFSVDTGEISSSVSVSDVQNQDGDPPFVEPTIVPPAVQPQANSASRELQSILCSRAPSDRNPGHEDHLQEPPPTQVSGDNIDNVDNSIHNCSIMVDSRSLCDAVKAT